MPAPRPLPSPPADEGVEGGDAVEVTVEHEGSEQEYDEGAGEHEEEVDTGIESMGEAEGGEAVEGVVDNSGYIPGGGIDSGIDICTFEELRLDQLWIDEAQGAWRTFLISAVSRDAAGEAIYAALFDSAPSLQSLFTTPRAVQAMRFMNGLSSFVTALSDPPGLKILVETLGFGHLALDVTVPRVVIFRDAILDLFQLQLGAKFSTQAYNGWSALLNYVGGAIIYIKATYSTRLKILSESWQIANDKNANNDKFAALGSAEGTQGGQGGPTNSQKAKRNSANVSEDSGEGDNKNTQMGQKVPTTYNEMFQFNAAVMGFGNSTWMQEILACFDNIVRNVANSNRLAEECDVLILRISKVAVKANLTEYKSCMLASLRSLLPKNWSTDHEVAWCWLWENVERMLYVNMGKPPTWEKSLGKFLDSLNESQAFEFRAAVYAKFFALCPAGQDFFKQSNTYLHLVATKIMVMTIDMYRDPVRMTDDISALGLRHVGYGIPTEYFGPFATACIEVLNTVTEDEVLIESFRWSLGLVAKSLVRTILEGSTIVMKAININTKTAMSKAIMWAPRGERASWMLMVQVGTQNISPLAWAIEAGALEAASAMISDLLTVRADRDRYYYGAEELFERHGDMVKKLIDNAPALLGELFDGLIWRSRLTQNGQRRVNYYIKHLVMDTAGNYHQTLEWIRTFKDPHIVCHPTLVVLADLIWRRVACRQFILRKLWFVFILVLFILSQSILKHSSSGMTEDGYPVKTLAVRASIFAIRMFIYNFGLAPMSYSHARRVFRAYRKRDVVRIFGTFPVPRYLLSYQDSVNLMLCVVLAIMLATCPIVYCLGDEDVPFLSGDCAAVQGILFFPYSVASMLATFLFFALLIDLAVFNNSVTAYVLVCGRMLSELGLFLFLGFGMMLMFSSSMSCLHQDLQEFQGIPVGAFSLFEIYMGTFSKTAYENLHTESIVLVSVWTFIAVSSLFLGNMLVAQLTCAYGTLYNDMVGYARLKRIGIITEAMPMVSPRRWESFVISLGFDNNIEFNEGDVGLAGGIAMSEAANAHPTTTDAIKRFGGSTSPTLKWPTEEEGEDDTDKLGRLEKLIQTCAARIEKMSSQRSRGHRGNSSAGVTSMDCGGSGEGSGQEKGEENE